LNVAYLSNPDLEVSRKTLQCLRKAFPHTSVNLFDMPPAAQFRALEARTVDVGFVGLRPPAANRDLVSEIIGQHKTVVALSQKHPLARKREITSRLSCANLLTPSESLSKIGCGRGNQPRTLTF
jgi:DNA-binding transcriptional LysR family regulator